MKILVKRYTGNKPDDIATLSDVEVIDDAGNIIYTCKGLEDDYDEVKTRGETRIPAGTYDVKVRKTGNKVMKYFNKFKWFRGMLWIVGVPNYKWIYIHIGNFVRDTLGCLLVGKREGADGRSITQSAVAFKELYLAVIDAAEADNLTIEYTDPSEV